MLKPDKWQAMFDSEGRVFGFRKALKLIVLGVCFHSCCHCVYSFLLLYCHRCRRHNNLLQNWDAACLRIWCNLVMFYGIKWLSMIVMDLNFVLL